MPLAPAIQTPDRPRRFRRAAFALTALGLAALGSITGVDPGAATTNGGATQNTCTVSSILVPSCGAWWGVSPGTSRDRRAGTLAFEKQLGARVDVYKAYRFSGQLFPTESERAIANQPGHHRLLNIDYVPDVRYNWAQVAAGRNDAELLREIAYLKAHFKRKMFISIHHEPEKLVREHAGSGHRAEDFAAMFRHVVTLFRDHGVKNVVWVWNVYGSQVPDAAPWFPKLWPGWRYVDWVASDPYGCYDAKVCHDFATSTVNQRFSPKAPWPGFYAWVSKHHPRKPIMYSEWGVYGNLSASARVAYIETVEKQLAKFPKIKAIVYFNSNRSSRGPCALVPGSATSAAVGRLARSPIFAQNVR